MIELFTPKRISPDCPFKGTQRLVNISISTLWCAFWLPRVMHTTELDSAVRSTPRSLTPWWDAHREVRLIRKCLFFVFSYLLHLLTLFFRKTFEVKKIPWTICDLQYQFHMNIFRHHREKAFVKLRMKTDTWYISYWLCSVMRSTESDSAVWCTPWSLTPRWDAHHRVFWELFILWLRSVMHTTEIDSAVWCTLHSAHCRAWLRSGMHTAELDSGVWCTPQSLIPRWDPHREVFFKNSNISAKSKMNLKIL